MERTEKKIMRDRKMKERGVEIIRNAECMYNGDRRGEYRVL